jgi:phosphopantetheinyl transferase (holo-ACP synthase)
MIDEDQLKELLGPMLMVPAVTIGRETSLASLDNSLGETRLRLALKRLGANLPAGLRPPTFGALDDLLRGVPATRPPVSPEMPISGRVAPFAGAFEQLRIGLDVQDVGSLPLCSDYWEDEFYRSIFGKSEIAYAVLQSNPRVHFAGFWCAKEALRKCDPGFAKVAPPDTIVAHDETGSPYIVWKGAGGEARLRHAISISHAANFAMAVVAAVPPLSPAIESDSSPPIGLLLKSICLTIAAGVLYMIVRFFR